MSPSDHALHKVLLVDDSPSQLALLSLAFGKAGFDVTTAKNGAEALQLNASSGFSCIVSDCYMPYLDGYQLCRLLKDDPETRHIPIVLLTSLQNRLSRFWARTCGANEFWVKSADVQALVELVDGLLQGSAPPPTPPQDPHLADKQGLQLIQKKLSDALERRLLEITLRNAISALGTHIRERHEVVWAFLGLMEELVAPGLLYVILPEPSGQFGFLLRSNTVLPQAGDALIQDISAEEKPGLTWSTRESKLDAPPPTPLAPLDFQIPLSAPHLRGRWGVRMDPEAIPAHQAYFQVAHEEFSRVFDAMVMLELLTQANLRLLKADQLKTEFVNTLSHEIRSPITATKGALGLLHNQAAGELPPKAQELVSLAERNIDRILRLVNEVLDLEKVEAGLFTLEESPVDLVRICQETLQSIETMGASKAVRYRLEKGEQTPIMVLGNEDRLVQCLTNLLANATKFSPTGGDVILRVNASNDWARVEVEDHGPGIPADFRGRIFGKFQQAEGQSGGTGLGLAITQRLAEAMHGEVGYQSQEGKGAIFFLRFPIHHGEDRADRNALAHPNRV